VTPSPESRTIPVDFPVANLNKNFIYKESTPCTATKTAGAWNFSKNIYNIFLRFLIGFMLASVRSTGH
jgi:hypothetical protein